MKKFQHMKLGAKFALAVGLVLLVLGFFDVWFSMKKDRDIMMNDIKTWTFLFAENVRVSLNTLMREDKMDMRFAMFDGMAREIRGLKSIRVIRGEKVDEIFRIVNEKDIIPKEERAIKLIREDISSLRGELKEAEDADERSDLLDEIASLNDDIEKTEARIAKAKTPKAIDKREIPKDDLDRQILDKGEPVYRFEGDNARVVIPYKIQKKGCSETSGCHKYAKEGDVLGGINIEFSIADVKRAMAAHNVKTAGAGMFKIAMVLAVTVLILNLAITRPVKNVADMLKDIADGRGDLTRRLQVRAEDEVGVLSRWFNTFMDGMQSLVRDIFQTTEKVAVLSDDVKRSAGALHGSAQSQMKAVNESASSIEEMNSSIKSIADDAENLMKSSEDASSSTLEMTATISEVADNIEVLAESVDKSAASINEIAASLKEVASHVDTLFEETDSVASAANQVNAATHSVASHAKDKAVLAEKVRIDASTIGMDAVSKTQKGMEKIRVEVNATAKVINGLEERSSEIGRIVGVIEEITETTNLLSLNAAIIAAQAGEHGKGFAVVAGEVKSLAKRTASSTKEIIKLIGLVQEEVTEAKKSMISSSSSVEEGVELSKAAGDALQQIIESAESSLDMAKKVELATEEQKKGLGSVTQSIQSINTMVEGIKKATDEQKNAADMIVQATEDMRERTKMVRQSSGQQSQESRHISKMIADVAHKMESIARATSEQRTAADRIVKSIEIMKSEIENNLVLSNQLDETVNDLDGQKNSLKNKVESFKV